MENHKNIFTNIYENKHWGDNGINEYNGSSGSGSDVSYNINTYVPLLRNIIIQLNINSINDLGCGDFKCGKYIYDDLSVIYNGYDAYDKVIEYNKKVYKTNKYNFNLNNNYDLFYSKYNFIHLDFCNQKEEIKKADLCILKDVIQHWSLENIYNFIDYLCINKICKYILICNCCNQTCDNTNIPTGSCRGLSAKYYPLKAYNPTILLNYNTKEVSLIRVY